MVRPRVRIFRAFSLVQLVFLTYISDGYNKFGKTLDRIDKKTKKKKKQIIIIVTANSTKHSERNQANLQINEVI